MAQQYSEELTTIIGKSHHLLDGHVSVFLDSNLKYSYEAHLSPGELSIKLILSTLDVTIIKRAITSCLCLREGKTWAIMMGGPRNKTLTQ